MVKFTLEQATKADRECRGIGIIFLSPRRCVEVGGQSHASAVLLPGKDPVPIV